MINIEKYIHDMSCYKGVWHAPETAEISYPADGNKIIYEIEDQSFWFKYRNNIVLEVVKKFSNCGPIFDVGGGNGSTAKFLCSNGFEVVLVEPGIEGCLNAQKRGLKNIVHSSFESKYFNLNSIPNIGIFDVLEHIKSSDKFLKQLHSTLIPSGKLFVTVPAFSGLWSKEDEFAGHFRRYSKSELCKLIIDQKFDLLYVTYYFSLFVLPIYIIRTIPSKIGFYKVEPQKVKKQHSINSLIKQMLNKLMNNEIDRIKNNKKLPFGSSLLLVAKKR